uniref:G-protein coupled receptors family 2 profile 2 domain-containing protein n=1 Tax=Clytia hemisphaerica TaxID=252671 RepID=A0A7M5XC19_9CNID|eukprot:TCONS_00013409-protein
MAQIGELSLAPTRAPVCSGSSCETIDALHKTFSSLSLIGSFVVLVLILILKEYHMDAQKMILFMVLSAFIDSIAYLMGDAETTHGATCEAQSFLMQYFDWATLLWVTMITTNLILIIKNKQSPKYYYIYHAVVWLGALFFAIVPFFENTYGHAGLWCWIKREYTGYRFGTWFGPLFFICFGMCITLGYVTYSVYQATQAQTGVSVATENINRSYRNELKRLAFYPLVYIILNIPTLAYRIEDASHPNKKPNYGILVVSSIFGPSVGAANAIIFATINLGSIRNLTWPMIRNNVILLFKRETQTQIEHNVVLEEGPQTSDSSEQYQPMP